MPLISVDFFTSLTRLQLKISTRSRQRLRVVFVGALAFVIGLRETRNIRTFQYEVVGKKVPCSRITLFCNFFLQYAEYLSRRTKFDFDQVSCLLFK